MESPILVGGDTLGFNGVFADKRAWYLAASNVRALANKTQGVVVFFLILLSFQYSCLFNTLIFLILLFF